MPKTSSNQVPAPDTPVVRLATGVGPPDAFEKGMIDPTVRLAHGPGAQGDNVLMTDGCRPMADDKLPALLVSYYYLEQFLKNRHRYHYRDWVMDSGAFSAHNSGVVINLQDYIDCCKRLMAEDPTLTEIYALDVIGDWKGSLRNTEEMWRQGVPAIPCFHVNEPWDALKGMAKDYPKIALGGVAQIGSKKALAWAGQCFARIWPKKVHGFALCSEKAMMTLPFHSCDSTSWEIGPCAFGNWRAFGGQRLSVRGSNQNLRAEVEWYLEFEQRLRVRWKKEMKQLEGLAPTVRLALANVSAQVYEQRTAEAFGPTVRLAETASDKTDAKVRAMEGIAGQPDSVTVRLAGKFCVGNHDATGEALAPQVRDDAKAEAFKPRDS